ncbi:MAG: sialidase family protein [Vicinamibacteraceae bacterium]
MPPQSHPAIVQSEFIYERAPFPSAHASTIVETEGKLVTAWFGGTEEGDPDVGIWLSRHDGRAWSAPVEVASGIQPDGTRHPAWNPVLFQPSKGPLLLFYKVGPSPEEWWGLVKASKDRGRSWSDATRLPDGILGPIRAKPIELADGTLLAGSSTEHDGWLVHMEWSKEPLGAWSKSDPVNSADEWDAIQPTILDHGKGRIQILCRSKQGVVTQAWSEDSGRSWSPMTTTMLPNPSAGIDSVHLTDGRFLLVYNPTERGRHQLRLATSRDGESWTPTVMLENEPGGFSYPAMIQARDGLVHVTYTWKRERIRHVVLDPAKL